MTALYTLEECRFSYHHEAVLNIEKFLIMQGSITAIIGANGSGKTTLLNLLAMLQLPVSGSIVFRDERVVADNYSSLQKFTGYVQQKPYLLNMTVRENIELGLRFRRDPMHTRHRKSAEVMHSLGIDHLAERNSHALSGGEVQKVAIARALVLEPEVLILDEPFTHLDRKSVAFFTELIARLRQDQNKTIIFTSHDQVAAQLLSDEIHSMVNGQLVPSAMTNLFYGNVIPDEHLFTTGRINIHIPGDISTGTHLTIDPGHLVLSRDKLQSSMRNQFHGRIAAVQEKNLQIQLTIEAGEKFHAIITHAAMKDLDIHFGDTVWVSFKSSAVHVF